jgi:4-cresol dehydrogenase (hydroxylating)
VPRAEVLEVMLFNTKDDRQLIDTLDSIRFLKLRGILNEVFLWNDYKLVSLVQRYPGKLSKEAPSLQEWLARFKRAHRIGLWNGTITLRSDSKTVGRYRKGKVYKMLRRSVQGLVSDKDVMFKLLQWCSPAIKRLFNIDLGLLFEIAQSPILLGKPSDQSINSVYWRKPADFDAMQHGRLEPEQGGVGFIWCDVVLPLIGEDIAHAVKEVSNIITRNSFEPMFGILCTNKRYVLLVTAIAYDRMIMGEDAKAMACHDQVLESLISQGHYPSRLGVQSMEKVPNVHNDYELFLQRLKKHVDPHDILAPGRYDFRNNWE